MLKLKKLFLTISMLYALQSVFLSFALGPMLVIDAGDSKVVPMKSYCMIVENNCTRPIGVPLFPSGATKSFFQNRPACTSTFACEAQCGSSNGTTSYTKPTTNLCLNGTTGTVLGSGPRTRSCSTIYNSMDCTVNKIVDGVCGAANGSSYANTTDVTPALACSAGTPSTVVWSSPLNRYVWSCNGIYSGSDASCSATKLPCAVQSVGGYVNIGAMLHAGTLGVSRVVSGTPINGYTTYTATAICYNGTDIISNEVGVVGCDGGYCSNGTSCLAENRGPDPANTCVGSNVNQIDACGNSRTVVGTKPIIQGTLSAWTDSTSCSVSCGGGTKTQIRTCDGAQCGGNCNSATLTQSVSCNTQTCAVCGDGIINSSDVCDNGASRSNSCGSACKLDCSGPAAACVIGTCGSANGSVFAYIGQVTPLCAIGNPGTVTQGASSFLRTCNSTNGGTNANCNATVGCTSNAQCGAGKVCRGQYCAPACTSKGCNGDCDGATYYNVYDTQVSSSFDGYGQCVTQCTINSDCTSPKTCLGYVAAVPSTCNGTYLNGGTCGQPSGSPYPGFKGTEIILFHDSYCMNIFSLQGYSVGGTSLSPVLDCSSKVTQGICLATFVTIKQDYLGSNPCSILGASNFKKYCQWSDTYSSCSSFSSTNSSTCTSHAGCSWSAGTSAILGTCQ